MRMGPPGRYPYHMRRALVVEDDPDIVELVQLYLARDGWTVETTDDGKQALENVRGGAATSCWSWTSSSRAWTASRCAPRSAGTRPRGTCPW